MKMARYITITVAIVFFALTFSACSSGPSDKIAKDAVTECLSNGGLPLSWGGSLMGARLDSIETIEIVEKGNYNKEGKYLPMRIRVKGVSMANMIFSKERHEFDAVGEFFLYKDDYGKWKARIDTFNPSGDS
jgi:hypothetical protein